jgi:hypothetical protein
MAELGAINKKRSVLCLISLNFARKLTRDGRLARQGSSRAGKTLVEMPAHVFGRRPGSSARA